MPIQDQLSPEGLSNFEVQLDAFRDRLRAADFIVPLDEALAFFEQFPDAPKPSEGSRPLAYRRFFRGDLEHDDSRRRPERYEILTVEYLEAFSNYLADRIEQLRAATGETDVTILEAGAGDGRFAEALRQRLDGRVRVVAVDNNAMGIETAYPVEQLTAEDGIAKYRPQLIICSWMDDHRDLTLLFRDSSDTQEYVLIGDPYFCGHLDTYGEYGGWLGKQWEEDGFVDEVLEHLTPLQLGFNYEGYMDRSRTICFRRVAPNGHANAKDREGTD